MSLGLNGTNISGGNFYSVAGNVIQTINTTHPDLIGSRRRRPPPPLEWRSDEQSGRHGGLPYAGPSAWSKSEQSCKDGQDLLGQPSRSSGFTSNMEGSPEGTDPGYVARKPTGNYFSAHSSMRPEYAKTFSDGWSDAPHHPDFTENNTFYAGGDITRIQVYKDSGIDRLYPHVVMEALHDSGERFPEPICHPGTRTNILRDLDSWSADGSAKPILWLHGSAGIGKSAIVQKFAGDCDQRGRAAASFFFKRGHRSCGGWDQIVATIAYQLAEAVPEFSDSLRQTIKQEKLIVGRAVPIQFERLLVQPFDKFPRTAAPPVVVVDGLDECADRKHQQQLLNLFIKAIEAGRLPIRLVVASRPEPQIREILEAKAALCRSYELSADESAYNDVKLYLGDEFRRVRRDCRRRGVDLGKPWPGASTLQQLVRRSSGIFIYATTVIGFVDDDFCHPADRLAAVMALDPNSTTPLDDLYTQILSVLPHERSQLHILHLLTHRDQSILMDPEEVDVVFNFTPGRTRLMLSGLHSLLKVPTISNPRVLRRVVRPLHASFGDYLRDSRRSGRWCIADPSLELDLLKTVIGFLSIPAIGHRTALRRVIAYALPKLLRAVVPTEEIIELLRNAQLQNAIFLSDVHRSAWPQADSLYPKDLIQLWDDHSWIADLARQLGEPRTPQNKPEFKFDSAFEMVEAAILLRLGPPGCPWSLSGGPEAPPHSPRPRLLPLSRATFAGGFSPGCDKSKRIVHVG
ncbi:hypothetical protein FB45DRAFT_531164 [Roridomyces roridus]|uniref:Nephrocystin 3-like N-terminal domain-containing protein n=1 Tax=Roridomyces roridus TaxID=1738132 RepID=A0AAD7BT24_9AGAR|nr:hypothetical protein FB45DRAFT_531164 [Roridomyces roridus]